LGDGAKKTAQHQHEMPCPCAAGSKPRVVLVRDPNDPDKVVQKIVPRPSALHRPLGGMVGRGEAAARQKRGMLR